MYPLSQERRRNREATVYLPALGGDGPRLDRTIRIYKFSQAWSSEESLKCCAALLAVSTEASGFSESIVRLALLENRRIRCVEGSRSIRCPSQDRNWNFLLSQAQNPLCEFASV
jgi:hypothetical protein